MANVLTDKDGNPLWIPAGTPGREKWAEVIYGISEADALKMHYEDFGGFYFPLIIGHTYGVDPKIPHGYLLLASKGYRRLETGQLPMRPSFSPIWTPFWLAYRFQTEEDLDEYLSRYAHKLINFDWKDTLESIYLGIKAVLEAEFSLESHDPCFPASWIETKKNIHKDANTSMELLAAEYFYYLGPIKFTLKYHTYPLLHSGPPGEVIMGKLQVCFPYAAMRNGLVFHTKNGKKLILAFGESRGHTSSSLRKLLLRNVHEVSGMIRKTGYFIDDINRGFFSCILPLLLIPEIVAIEARDEPTVRWTEDCYDELSDLLLAIHCGPLDLKQVYLPGFTRLTTSIASTQAPTIAQPQPTSEVPPPTTATAGSQPAPELSSATPSSPTIAPTSAEQSRLMESLGGLVGLAIAGIVLLQLLRRK